MSAKFLIRTFRVESKLLSDFFQTVVYDWSTGLFAVCTGETPEASEAEAAKQLAIMLTRTGMSLEKRRDYPPWRF